MSDLVILGQDPRFGGGAHEQTAAFWRAALELGRDPELHYLEHPSLGSRRPAPPLDMPGVRPPFGHADALNQLWGASRLSRRARGARSLWVVATTAQYGAAAPRSGRPYACWVGTSLAAEHAARRAGLRRSRRLAAGLNAPVLRRLERHVLREAAAVYATSAASRDEVASAGALDPAAIGILPLPVDVDAFQPEPDETWLARLERPALVFVGRGDDPRKNLALALEAFALVRSRVPSATLRLVGPRTTASGAGVDVRGEVASVAEHLRDASLFILPSRQEGFCIAAAEALAAGVPVVSTPCGGPEEMLRDSGGGVVTDGWSASELADAVVDLLEHPADLAARRRRARGYILREHSPAALARSLGAAIA